MYAFEISEDNLVLGDRADTDDDRCWEFAKELLPVVMVTVDEPEELFMISSINNLIVSGCVDSAKMVLADRL